MHKIKTTEKLSIETRWVLKYCIKHKITALEFMWMLVLQKH